MKKIYKKIISIILTLSICVQSVSIIVSAQTATDSAIEKEESEYAYAIGEDISKREESVKYFHMSDGSMTAVSYASPVHYLDEQGKFVEIDNTLVESEEGFTNKSNSFKVTLPKNADDEIVIENEGKKISFALNDVEKVKSKAKTKSKEKNVAKDLEKAKTKKEKAEIINNDKFTLKNFGSGIVFENVSDNVNLSYEISGSKLKESIILSEKNSRNDFSYTFKFSGLVAVLNKDNSVSFMEDGKEYFNIQAPFMEDADGAVSTDIKVILTTTETGCIYELKPNKKWLNDKERKYPVIIDPPITPKLTARDIKDATAIYSGYNSTMESWAKDYIRPNRYDVLMVGKYLDGSNTEVATCIYAAIPSGIPNTARIINASMSVLLWYTCNESIMPYIRIDAFPITSDWNTGNINEDSILFTTPKSGGYAIPQISAQAIDYTYIYQGNGMYHNFDITKAAQSWQHGANNYGVMLRADEYALRDNDCLFIFFSSDYSDNGISYRPAFTYNYRDTTGLEDYWSYHSVSAGDAGVGYINDFSGNLTFVHQSASYANDRYSTAISHIYNSNDSQTGGAYGNGWRLNIGEFGSETIESTSYYYYKDGDGTRHYFYNDNGTYKDEDGLGYVYTASSGSYAAQITNKNHDTMYFDSNGKLRRITDSNSNSIDFNYGAYGLSAVKFGDTDIMSLSYSGGKLSQITNNKTGHITNFSYDSSGNLITIQDVWDSQNIDTYSYTYNAKRLMSATDSTGYRIDFSYVSDNNISRVNRVTESVLGDDNVRTNGQVMTFLYKMGNQTVVEDSGLDGDITATADNNKMVYQFDVYGQPVSVYDDEGRGANYQYSKTSNQEHRLSLSSASYGYIPGGKFIADGNFVNGSWWWYYSDNVIYDSGATLNSNSQLYQYTTLNKGKYNFSAIIEKKTDNAKVRMSVQHQSTEMLAYTEIDFSEADCLEANVVVEITYDQTPVIIMFEEIGGGTLKVNSCDLYKLPYSNKINYLTDGSFDNDYYIPDETLVQWQMDLASFGAQRISTTQYDGTAGTVMKMSRSVAPIEGTYNRVYCIPSTYSGSNDVFLLSGWAKATAMSSEECTFEITMEVSCTDGSKIIKSLEFNDNITDWQFASMAVPIEKAYYSVKVTIDYSQQLYEGYFDDIQLIIDDAVSYTYDSNGNVVSVKTAATNNSYNYDGNSRLTSAVDTTGTNFKYSYDDNHNMVMAVSDAANIIQYDYNAYGQAISLSASANLQYSKPEGSKNYYIHLRSNGRYMDENYNDEDVLCMVTSRFLGSAGDDTQEYTVTEQSDGYYTIGYDNNYITAKTNTLGSSFAYGTDSTLDAAKFKFVKSSNGGYYIVSKINEQWCITNKKNVTSNTEPLTLALIEENNDEQIWYFEEAVFKHSIPTIKDKTVYAIRENHAGKYFAADNLTAGSSLDTVVGENNSTKFLIEKYNNTDYYYIRISNTNMALNYNAESNAVTVEEFTPDAQSQLFTITVHERNYIGQTVGSYCMSINPKADATKFLCAWPTPPVSAGNVEWFYSSYLIFEEILYSSSTAVYNEDGTQLMSATDNSTGVTTNYTYDSLGRVTEVQTGNSVTESEYDSRNRVTEITSGNMSVNYEYNSKKKLSSISTTAYNGTQTYSFEYDSFGNTKKISVGNNALAQYSYVGNTSLMSQMLYGNTDSISYTYDKDYRVIKKTYTDNGNSGDTSETADVSYEYDVFGNIYKLRDGFSNLTSYYNYDLIGRITRVSKSDDTWKYYNYDTTDRISGYTTYILDKSVNSAFTYGELGEVSGVANTIANRADSISYSYDALNRLTGRTLNNVNSTSAYTYRKGETGQQTVMLESLNNGKDVYTYTYDNYGNISTVCKNGTETERYEYDENQQLTYAKFFNDEYEFTYVGGASANLFKVYKNGEVIKTYGYATDWLDKLNSFNGVNISYDAIGNPLNWRDNMSFVWEYGRRLAGVTKGTDNITYSYDADGLRSSKTVNNVTTEYYWLEGILHGQRTGNEYIIFLYDENGIAYGMLVNNNGTEQYYYYLFNAQGDVVGIMNSEGQTVAEYSYDAWGNVLSVTGTQATTIGQLNPIRYRGYYYDTETGFYYLQSRYYDPYVQRFINADGYVSTGQGISGYNMFAYCSNNPVNRVDSTGQFWLTALAITAVVAICTFTLSGCSDPSNSFAKAPDLDIDTAPAKTYDCLGNALNKQINSNLIGYTKGDSTDFVREYVRDIVGVGYYRPLDSIDSPIYDDEYRVAVKTSDVDYHFIRETEFGWYDKPGDLAGSYVKPEYVDGAVWSYTKNIFDEEVTSYYNTDTKYFAITIGWDENG